jgi:TPR repeat protein
MRRAAERKGKAEDQYRLGLLLYHGEEGLKQDKVAATQWFRKAAAKEHAGAQTVLGACYINGEGVEQNHAIAATWVIKATDQRAPGRSRAPRQTLPRRQGRGSRRRTGGGVVGERRRWWL